MTEPLNDSQGDRAARDIEPGDARFTTEPLFRSRGDGLIGFALMVGAIVFGAVFGLFALAAWIGGW